MMQNSSKRYENYTPYPEHTISDICQSATSNGGHIVNLQHLKTGETTVIEVSFCTILIGSRPDLRFLSNSINKNHNNLNSNVISLSDDSTDGLELRKCNKRMSWLKSLCAKCKHINLCDRTTGNGTFNKKNEYKKLCGHNRICNGYEINLDDKNDVLSGALGLGEDQTKPIDCKSNPIAVNKYTNQLLNTSAKGLYAMGPLVSDNFVRFIPGGALAITSALHKEND